jgi:hypothetical protein
VEKNAEFAYPTSRLNAQAAQPLMNIADQYDVHQGMIKRNLHVHTTDNTLCCKASKFSSATASQQV